MRNLSEEEMDAVLVSAINFLKKHELIGCVRSLEERRYISLLVHAQISLEFSTTLLLVFCG